MKQLFCLLLTGLWWLAAHPVLAQTQPPARRSSAPAKARPAQPSPSARRVVRRRRRYTLYLVTMGSGDHLYTYFGHNAIRVVDYQLGSDVLYNFGTFAFPRKINPKTIVKFGSDYVNFRLKYWVSRQSPRFAVRVYRYFNRTYSERKLLLTEQEAELLVNWLRNHYKGKNRFYRYHHYLQNCSTKVRDALYAALGPTFRTLANQRSKQTYRSHVMRQTRGNPFLMTAMDFGMGPYADRKLTRWEDFFLPHELENFVTDPIWQKKRARPLVTAAVVHYKRRGKAPFAWNPVWIVYSLLGFWLLVAGLTWKKDFFRLWFRILLAFLTLLGFVLGFMMFMTGMPEPPKNANFLLYHPAHLMAWWLIAKRRWQEPKVYAFLRWYFCGHLLVAVLYLLAKGLGITPLQTNLHYILAALVPMALWVLWSWNQQPDAEKNEFPEQPIPTR